MSDHMGRAETLAWGKRKLTEIWPTRRQEHDGTPKLIVRSAGSFSYQTKRSDDAGTP